jgi:excisionase family DNA binding protein
MVVMDGDTLSPAQAARFLGLSRERVLQLEAEGKLSAQMTPLGRLFDRLSVERLVQERKRLAAAR